jgi:hypothetical protein
VRGLFVGVLELEIEDEEFAPILIKESEDQSLLLDLSKNSVRLVADTNTFQATIHS